MAVMASYNHSAYNQRRSLHVSTTVSDTGLG